jgi:hypothetical protein
MRDIIRELDDRIAEDLKALWGGRLPSWDEFKKASKTHRVRTDKGIASKGIFLRGVPKGHQILFGIITAAGVFLIPIISIITYFLGYVSVWVPLCSFLVGWYLYKVTLDGACDGIRYGAEKSEPLYQYLVSKGAFLFGPD